jgi:hypothetical protein
MSDRLHERELVEALEALLSVMPPVEYTRPESAAWLAVKRAHAALAKAKGERP